VQEWRPMSELHRLKVYATPDRDFVDAVMIS
jgi:hypothetical protein